MEPCEDPVCSGRTSTPSAGPAQPDCLLTVGSQCIAAILTDEPDAGLQVLIQASPLFWVEDTGVLQTSDSKIAVRVANIVRMEPVENEFTSSMPGFRIGLARLDAGEENLPSPAMPSPARKSFRKLPWLVPLTGMRVSVGGVIAFALIVTPLILVAAACRHHFQAAAAGSPAATATNSSTPPHPAVPVVPEPTPAILRLPGVEPFLSPAVAKKLRLTPSQRDALGRLDRTTRQALQDLDNYWGSAGPTEHAGRQNVILDAARQESLRLLTDQQRRQWDALAP